MFSLKPKESGRAVTPPPPVVNTTLLKGGIVLAAALFLGLGYHSYSTRATLQSQIDVLQSQLEEQVGEMKAMQKHATDTEADIDVVTKRIGVTAEERGASGRYAQQ